jgi:ubiquitin related modifier 1
MGIKVEFSGGLDLLFSNQKSLLLEQNDQLSENTTLKDLINILKHNYLKDRPELFSQEETVRPGILVMVNEVDWELLGGLEYKVMNGDNVLFISTLHGG